jgi:nucleotide-binding universal stress UspA family protein
MPRILVVVDGTPEAALALERAMDAAAAVPETEILLLGIEPVPSSWQVRRSRPSGHDRQTCEILRRANSSAAARRIPTRSRVETGAKADVVTRVAEQEGCTHIFVPEAGSTRTGRALVALAAACGGRAATRIITQSGVPVTVVAAKGSR